MFSPKNLQEAIEFSKLLAESDLVPENYKGRPGNCLVAMQMGAELGLQPTQALQNIAVVNGRPAVWGDAALAIVKAHPLYAGIDESIVGEGKDRKAVCVVSRKGEKDVTSEFSVVDAIRAGLWDNDKKPVWKSYPDRMLKMRARGFALRDQFPDALKGIYLAEEAQDIPIEREVTGEHTFAPKQESADDKLKSALKKEGDSSVEPKADASPKTAPDPAELSATGGEDEDSPAESDDPPGAALLKYTERLAKAQSQKVVHQQVREINEAKDLSKDEKQQLRDYATDRLKSLK